MVNEDELQICDRTLTHPSAIQTIHTLDFTSLHTVQNTLLSELSLNIFRQQPSNNPVEIQPIVQEPEPEPYKDTYWFIL